MITTKEFEKQIQRDFDSRLTIIRNTKGAPDCAGVYFCGYFIGITVPADYIYYRYNPNHKDANGVPFRGVLEISQMIKPKIIKFKRDFADGLYDS